MTNERVDALVKQLDVGHSPGDGKLLYREGYKFVVHEPLIVRTGIIGWPFVIHDKMGRVLGQHFDQGLLVINPSYAWNGESVSPYDTKAVIRASCAHDIAYQGGNQGSMSHNARGLWDDLYRRMMLIDGAWRVTAAVKRSMLGQFAGFAYAQQAPEVLTAP